MVSADGVNLLVLSSSAITKVDLTNICSEGCDVYSCLVDPPDAEKHFETIPMGIDPLTDGDIADAIGDSITKGIIYLAIALSEH